MMSADFSGTGFFAGSLCSGTFGWAGLWRGSSVFWTCAGRCSRISRVTRSCSFNKRDISPRILFCNEIRFSSSD
jgi:hypothetical protein